MSKVEYTLNDKVREEAVFIDLFLYYNLTAMQERGELDSELVKTKKGWRTYLTNHRMMTRFFLSLYGKDHTLLCVPDEKLFIVGMVNLDACDDLIDLFEDNNRCELLLSYMKRKPNGTTVHNINRHKGIVLWDFDSYQIYFNANSI